MDPKILYDISEKVIKILLIIMICFISSYSISAIIKRIVVIPIISTDKENNILVKMKRKNTLQGLLKGAIKYAIYFIGCLMILRELGIDYRPILAGAGVIGLAIGIGAQKLIRDVINGFFILLEGQFDVGDDITIGTINGKVEEIGIRTTKIRDNNNSLYIISNGDISQVCNHSRKR